MPETLYGSLTMTNIANTTPARPAPSSLGGGRVHVWMDTVEVTAAASVGSLYYMARLPSNAVILPQSNVYWDDMGTGGATLDIGDANYADGLATDIAIDTSAGSSAFLEAEGIQNYGKMLWELLGYAADPGGTIDIALKLATAAASAGGTLTVAILYTGRG